MKIKSTLQEAIIIREALIEYYQSIKKGKNKEYISLVKDIQNESKDIVTNGKYKGL